MELFRRSAGAQSEPHVRAELADLADEVAQDRAALRAVLVELGVRRSPLQEGLVALGEKVGRLKPNGTLVRRSALSDFLELEAMVAAVRAKQLGWLALRRLADDEPRLDAGHLEALVARAEEQQARLERLRLEQAPIALTAPTLEERS